MVGGWVGGLRGTRTVEREKERLGSKGFSYLRNMRVSEGERERDSREERTRGYSWTWNIMKCLSNNCYSFPNSFLQHPLQPLALAFSGLFFSFISW